MLDKMQTKGISVYGYHGGVLDGVNSNLFLKHLEFLSGETPVKVRPIFNVLEKFKVVVQGCFGIDLSKSYKADIKAFNDSVNELVNHCKQKLKINLNPT